MAEIKKDTRIISPSLSGRSNDNAQILHIDDRTHMSKAEKAQAVGAIAKNPNVSLETFAHLDIDRLLRKIDLRLIPMLTLLVSKIYKKHAKYRLTSPAWE